MMLICLIVISKKKIIIIMVEGIDAINYIKENLKIRLKIESDIRTDYYVLVAQLVMDGEVLSEDKIEFEGI